MFKKIINRFSCKLWERYCSLGDKYVVRGFMRTRTMISELLDTKMITSNV